MKMWLAVLMLVKDEEGEMVRMYVADTFNRI